MDQELKDILLSMQGDMKSMRVEMQEMRQDITKINVTLENDVKTQLQLLGEAQAETRAKVEILDDVAERVEEIQITVNAMEAVTKQNCTDIKQLRIAK